MKDGPKRIQNWQEHGTSRNIDIPAKATYHAGAIMIHTIRKQKEDE